MQHLTNNGDALLAALKPTEKHATIQPREIVCLTCKKAVKTDVINYVYVGYDWQKMKTILKPCPTCSVETARQAAMKRDMEVLAHIFGGANIPWRARTWDFDTFPIDADQKAKALMQEFVARHLAGDEVSKRFFFLGGATGRCKTSLALSALKEALKAGKAGLYLMTAELMVKLQASFGKAGGFSQDELLHAVNTVEWLVLDDLAVESGQDQKVSTFTLKSLYMIIQKRADAGLYTIFTSNLSLNDLASYWRPAGVLDGQFHEGMRIVERLKEFCDGCTVRGKNMRQG